MLRADPEFRVAGLWVRHKQLIRAPVASDFRLQRQGSSSQRCLMSEHGIRDVQRIPMKGRPMW